MSILIAVIIVSIYYQAGKRRKWKIP